MTACCVGRLLAASSFLSNAVGCAWARLEKTWFSIASPAVARNGDLDSLTSIICFFAGGGCPYASSRWIVA